MRTGPIQVGSHVRSSHCNTQPAYCRPILLDHHALLFCLRLYLRIVAAFWATQRHSDHGLCRLFFQKFYEHSGQTLPGLIGSKHLRSFSLGHVRTSLYSFGDSPFEDLRFCEANRAVRDLAKSCTKRMLSLVAVGQSSPCTHEATCESFKEKPL